MYRVIYLVLRKTSQYAVADIIVLEYMVDWKLISSFVENETISLNFLTTTRAKRDQVRIT